MSEFFKGWRRKIGGVTLVLACVFAAGWMRSWVTYDAVAYRIGGRYNVIESELGDVLWSACDEERSWQEIGWKSCGRRDPKMAFMVHATISMRYMATNVSALTLDYRMIVLPLTLVSAFLLLSKPRQSTSKKTSEPIVPKLD